MKKSFFIVAYSLYLFVLLGLIFHTSSTPQVFGKYTTKYFLMLVALIILFVPFLFLLKFMTQQTTIAYKGKRVGLSPLTKMLILILLLVVVLVIPSEVYYRKIYKYYEVDRNFMINNFDPFIQYQEVPNAALPIDSYNFRYSELSVIKPKDTYRIFVLGGSTVFNRQLPFKKTPTEILEKRLQDKYPQKKIEVINAGTDGFTTQHSLMEYLFKIKNFNPDMIIMWHGINDWWYSCTPPDISYGRYKFDYSHMFNADARMAFEHFSQPPIISIYSLSLTLFWQAIKDNLYTDFHKEIEPFTNVYNNIKADDQYEMTGYPSIEAYKRNIVSLIRITEADGVTLILGNQPVIYNDRLSKKELSRIKMPNRFCPKDGKIPSIKSVTTAMTAFNKTTEEVAKENHVRYVDLNARVPKTLEYFIDDVHYTEKGSQLVADELYRYISGNNVIR